MDRTTEVNKDAVLQEAAEKVRAAIDSHLANLPLDEQEKKWDALENYLNEVSSVSPSKP